MDDNRLQNLVMIVDIPLGRFCLQTPGTTDTVGREILGTVDGHEILYAEKPIAGKLLTTLQSLKKDREYAAQLPGGDEAR